MNTMTAMTLLLMAALSAPSPVSACFREDPEAVYAQMKKMEIDIAECPTGLESPVSVARTYCGNYSGNKKTLRRLLWKTLGSDASDSQTALLDDRRVREQGYYVAYFTIEYQALKLRMNLSSGDLTIDRFSDLPSDIQDTDERNKICSETFTPPEPISGDLMEIPEEIRIRRLARTDVVIEASIDSNGVIENAVVMYDSSHSQGVQDEVLEQVKQWRYSPAREPSGAVPYVILIYLKFTIGSLPLLE
jgi:TonB family protein